MKKQYNECQQKNLELFKQLQHKTKECEGLKKQYDCYACGTCNGKEDYINMQRHCENALKSLQAEREKVKELEERNKKLHNDRCDREKYCTDLILENRTEKDKADKYKQALEEIKHQVTELFLGVADRDRPYCEQILQIIANVR